MKSEIFLSPNLYPESSNTSRVVVGKHIYYICASSRDTNSCCNRMGLFCRSKWSKQIRKCAYSYSRINTPFNRVLLLRFCRLVIICFKSINRSLVIWTYSVCTLCCISQAVILVVTPVKIEESQIPPNKRMQSDFGKLRLPQPLMRGVRRQK